MKRIIYSFYIDIPDNELDLFDLNILKKGHTPTNVYTKYQFREHYENLLNCKINYANNINVPFRIVPISLTFLKLFNYIFFFC